MEIILASSSERRIEIMKQLGFDFRVVPSNKEEFVESYSSPEDLVMQLAKIKGESVFEENKDALVLGFDTLVFCDGEVLGKPQNEEDCIRMIKLLKNNKHLVVTGGYIRAKDYKESFYTECYVHMTDINEEEIVEYAKTKEPYDKAGGYAIQGFVGRFIDRVDGDFFTVIGLPKSTVYDKVNNYLRNK